MIATVPSPTRLPGPLASAELVAAVRALAARLDLDPDRGPRKRWDVPLAEVTTEQAEELLAALREREGVAALPFSDPPAKTRRGRLPLDVAERIRDTPPLSAERDAAVEAASAELGWPEDAVWCAYADALRFGQVTAAVWLWRGWNDETTPDGA